MLKVKVMAINAPSSAVMEEGKYHNNGGVYTKEIIEQAARLPQGYSVGTMTMDSNFCFKVIEV